MDNEIIKRIMGNEEVVRFIADLHAVSPEVMTRHFLNGRSDAYYRMLLDNEVEILTELKNEIETNYKKIDVNDIQ